MDIPFRRILRNAIIFSVVVLIGAEFVFRKRYVEPVREADPLINEIQQYLELDEVIGFKWKANIDASEGIVFEDGDATAYPLSTDDLGFINSPQAKADIEAGNRPNIIGVGDSFLEHAAPVLTEFFGAHDLVYRNLAMHRTSPPQFTDVVETYALPLKPDLIVYSIYENDFAETVDYLNWEASGLDWFTFHSGTWCGSPLAVSESERRAVSWVPGYHAVYRRLPTIGTEVSRDALPRIVEEIDSARRMAADADVGFALLLIPSKADVLGESGALWGRYVLLLLEPDIKEILEAGGLIDLRAAYSDYPEPASLYYETNGHWNEAGIKLAAEEILKVYNESVE